MDYDDPTPCQSHTWQVSLDQWQYNSQVFLFELHSAHFNLSNDRSSYDAGGLPCMVAIMEKCCSVNTAWEATMCFAEIAKTPVMVSDINDLVQETQILYMGKYKTGKWTAIYWVGTSGGRKSESGFATHKTFGVVRGSQEGTIKVTSLGHHSMESQKRSLAVFWFGFWFATCGFVPTSGRGTDAKCPVGPAVCLVSGCVLWKCIFTL